MASTYTFAMLRRTLDAATNSAAAQGSDATTIDELLRGMEAEGSLRLPRPFSMAFTLDDRIPVFTDAFRGRKSNIIQTLSTRLSDLLLVADNMSPGLKSLYFAGMTNDPAAVNKWIQAMDWDAARLHVLAGDDGYRLLLAPVSAFIVRKDGD